MSSFKSHQFKAYYYIYIMYNFFNFPFKLTQLPHPLFSLDVEQALCSHDKHPHLRLELLWDPAHRDRYIILNPFSIKCNFVIVK